MTLTGELSSQLLKYGSLFHIISQNYFNDKKKGDEGKEILVTKQANEFTSRSEEALGITEKSRQAEAVVLYYQGDQSDL